MTGIPQPPSPVDGKTTVYLCRNRACQAPVTSVKQLAEQLDNPP